MSFSYSDDISESPKTYKTNLNIGNYVVCVCDMCVFLGFRSTRGNSPPPLPYHIVEQQNFCPGYIGAAAELSFLNPE